MSQPPAPPPSPPLPPGVTWDPTSHTLRAGPPTGGGALTAAVVWGVRGLAVLIAVVVLVGGAMLGDGPPWWVLLVVVAAWVLTTLLHRGQEQQDAAWEVRFSPAGIEWQDAHRSGGVPWAHVQALRPASRWAENPGGPRFESRWLEVVERDGTVHELPRVTTRDRWPQVVAAAQAHGLVPAGVRLDPPVTDDRRAVVAGGPEGLRGLVVDALTARGTATPRIDDAPLTDRSRQWWGTDEVVEVAIAPVGEAAVAATLVEHVGPTSPCAWCGRATPTSPCAWCGHVAETAATPA